MHGSLAKCGVGSGIIFLSKMYTQCGVQQMKNALTIHMKTFIPIRF